MISVTIIFIIHIHRSVIPASQQIMHLLTKVTILSLPALFESVYLRIFFIKPNCAIKLGRNVANLLKIYSMHVNRLGTISDSFNESRHADVLLFFGKNVHSRPAL